MLMQQVFCHGRVLAAVRADDVSLRDHPHETQHEAKDKDGWQDRTCSTRRPRGRLGVRRLFAFDHAYTVALLRL